MPAMTNVVLTDGTDNHTFKPRGIDGNGVATFVESSGVPIGDKRVTVARARTSAGREKVTYKVIVPQVQSEVINGVSRPSIVRTAYADLTFTFDGTSTTEERNDMRIFVAGLLGIATSVSLIDDLDYLYGG